MHGDADAGGHVQLLPVEIVGLGGSGHQFRGDDADVFVAVKILRDHHEFVATQARHHVGFAHAGGEPLRHLLQQSIAGVVAERVVDFLEPVQVHEQHGKVVLMPPRPRDGKRQALLEAFAVGQQGERIVIREMMQLTLGFAAQ